MLIFDLNGTLGYMTRQAKTLNAAGIYTQEAKPLYSDFQQLVYARPSLQYINYDLLIKNKQHFDVGVWSSQGKDVTQLLVKQFFGKFFTQ